MDGFRLVWGYCTKLQGIFSFGSESRPKSTSQQLMLVYFMVLAVEAEAASSVAVGVAAVAVRLARP